MKRFSIAVLALLAAVSLFSATALAADGGQKVLVTFFSTSGHTSEIAGYIADSLGADKFQITPAEPYDEQEHLSPSARRDQNSRVNVEDQNDAARPAIASKVENIADYDIIFVGYPIWFGKAPKIVHTFLEAHDLAGKTVVTFCTSGSSEIGESSKPLRGSMDSSTKLVVGKTLRNATRADVVNWVNSLELGLTAK